ncbi:unnamed protein product [Gongylonema pulchrum]|uniref:SURP motif domain-containing protein n=1 Tax=Gongylonema pulchrum TaxID=637853 RepID=A0A183DY25_9BILA|nr:unnamed protein product [Gongylonema pulchrum]
MLAAPLVPPRPPDDEDSRNVIDRLAEFVAKNGMEFEERTRAKQYGDPRFGFLFGGEFADYYRFRVLQEIQKLNSGTIPPAGLAPPPPLPPVAPNVQIPQFDASAALAQMQTYERQIADSEANLRAQFQSIEAQKEAQLAVAIEKAEASKITTICEQVSLDVEPLAKMLDQLSGHCSKDVISAQLAVAIEKAEASKITTICEQVSLDVEPLAKMLDQLSGHCSKDVISKIVKFYIYTHIYAYVYVCMHLSI